MTALAEGELAKAAPPRFAESILPKITFTSIWGAKYKKTVDHTLTGFLVYSLEPGFFYPGSIIHS